MIYLRYNNEKMKPRISSGKFPRNLTFGFEAEVDRYDGYGYKWMENGRHSKYFDSLRKSTRKFYCYKCDGSLTNGMEIVSQPFNWNWILGHRKSVDSLASLYSLGFRGLDSCGFHVHINRKYFAKNHLEKMAQLYYFNERFIKKVSRRKDWSMEYCNPDPDELGFYEEDEDKGITAKDIVGAYRSDWQGINKNCALNMRPSKTIEVRIFQGTTNPQLIWAYLEFVVASVMFTKDVELEDVHADNFMKYIKKNRRQYPRALKLVTKPRYFDIK